MPMRIVNLKAASGGGGGTVVNSDTSGLFKFVHHDTATTEIYTVDLVGSVRCV